MLSTIALVMSLGAGRPGMRAVVITISWSGDVACDEFRLLLFIFGRHLFRIAACGFRLLELFILDRDELAAKACDLLLGRGANVGCGDDSAQAASGGDGLQALRRQRP